MGMDTDALRWFQQVADGTTVTEVSELEAVTQPGVSRALARLEAQVGTPLLRKSGRILRLTHAGMTFKRHVDIALHHLDDGIAAVTELLEPDTGVVALAFQQSLGTWLVPDLVGTFRAAHPRVRFHLTQVRDEAVSSALEDAGPDRGREGPGRGRDGDWADLEIGTLRPADPAVESRLVAVEPLRVALPRGHALAGRAGIELAELAEVPFVALRPASALRQLGDELCAAAGFAPDVVFEGDDLSTVRGFVAAGLGAAIVPAPREGSPEAAAGPVRYLEIRGAWAAREIILSWSGDRRLLPAAEQFRRHVIARAEAGLVPALTAT
ncbi:MAG TPA: LysR family transcriptional regulator [Solirubrobacteraceae bacterium]|nr:LysR family transcriptional regulator [Solirubrobacteraceae bacterium]